MSTLDHAADFAAAGTTDFVSTDAAALASHMSRCARERGRFFTLQATLESVHSVVSPRIVTVTALAVLVVGILGLVSAA
ncbi:MAG: hypothetical protein Q7T87_15525 [Polaromonas sp.]|nr:hypothetical protein [Polaromonas sp.]